MSEQQQHNNDPRETHFAEFAKQLWDELLHAYEGGDWIDTADNILNEEANDRYRLMIAQRVYDLVHFVLNRTLATMPIGGPVRILYAPEDIPNPDLTKWPAVRKGE